VGSANDRCHDPKRDTPKPSRPVPKRQAPKALGWSDAMGVLVLGAAVLLVCASVGSAVHLSRAAYSSRPAVQGQVANLPVWPASDPALRAPIPECEAFLQGVALCSRAKPKTSQRGWQEAQEVKARQFRDTLAYLTNRTARDALEGSCRIAHEQVDGCGVKVAKSADLAPVKAPKVRTN
jgi:hypothetical protein